MPNIPTTPGYYWRRGPNEDGQIVEQVVEVGPMVTTAPSELFYWVPGDIGGIYVQEEKGVYWQGPIDDMQTLDSLATEIYELQLLLAEKGHGADSKEEVVAFFKALLGGIHEE